VVACQQGAGNHKKEFIMKNRQAVTSHSLPGIGLTFLIGLFLIFSACDQPTENTTDIPASRSVNKFQAISYTGNDDDRIKYSYTYDGYDFYYIYLGELKNIPIFYRNARYYAGNTQWTYTFSTTDIEKDYVKNIIENSSQEVIGIVNEHTYSVTNGENVTAEIGYKLKIKKVVDIDGKITAEDIWSDYTSDTNTSSFHKTTSLTKTREHAFTHTFQTMESDQWVFTPADKVGYYRWTMFSASDVYLYVIRDSKDGGIYYEFREYVIPDAYFWQLDYSETPSFRKSNATSFEFDISILENLPKPSLDFISYTIAYNANGGSGTMGSDVHGYGLTQNLRLNTFVPPSGYSFAGWARSPSSSSIEFSDGEIVSNLTNERNATVSLYAIWTLADVTMERTLGNSNLSMSIPSNVTRAIIRGESGETYPNSEIIVAQRSLPLTIEVHNVNAVGRNGNDGGVGQGGGVGKPVISMGTDNARVPDLTIVSYGTENKIVGGKGGNGGQGNNKSTGSNGGNGGTAIMADKVTITGDTDITLKGGDGGNGGRGGNLGTSVKGTSGGRGGNGGVSINANNITINIIGGMVRVLRSQGGNGGTRWHGSTGMASGGSNGANGVSGEQFTSTPVKINGEVVDYEL
jgi:hypothetical protein